VETDDGPVEILHGATLLATGGSEVKPQSYGYGDSPKVITQKEMEALLDRGEFDGGKVVMVQCVESREEAENCRPYCSRVCCTHALKNARKILEASPDTEITVLYRDFRAYGDFEEIYQAAREEGVVFTAFDLDNRPSVALQGESVSVTWREPSAGIDRTVTPDYLVLSAGMTPDIAGNAKMAEFYGVETDDNGFFVEKNAKAATTDFAKAGMYAAGLCHAPKHFEESLVQAGAAAARSSAVLSARELSAPDNPSYVVDRLCSRCGMCVDACPYGARSLDMETNVAVVDEIICRACGGCTTACPNKAAQQYGSTPAQLLAGLDELL
jgi:heterodisulfide reductase subunit A